MFHELTRPFKVIKNQIFSNLNVFSSFKKMIDDARNQGDVEKKSKGSPVAKGVSRSEFKKRYRSLNIYTSVILFFLSYTILFFISSLNAIAFIVSGVIIVFFLASYFSSLYRAWLARYYFRNWSDRFTHANLNVGSFIDDLVSRKRLIFPVFDINKEI